MQSSTTGKIGLESIAAHNNITYFIQHRYSINFIQLGCDLCHSQSISVDYNIESLSKKLTVWISVQQQTLPRDGNHKNFNILLSLDWFCSNSLNSVTLAICRTKYICFHISSLINNWGRNFNYNKPWNETKWPRKTSSPVLIAFTQCLKQHN